MKKFNITVYLETFSITVEAEDKNDALNKAASKLKGWRRESAIDIFDQSTFEVEEIIEEK